MTGQNIAARVGARFPYLAQVGSTGQGALAAQGQPLPPQDLSVSDPGKWSTLAAFDPGAPATGYHPGPDANMGLPGSQNPNTTPINRAGPVPGMAQNYGAPWATPKALQAHASMNERQSEIYGTRFPGAPDRYYDPRSQAGIHLEEHDVPTGESLLQPLTGSILAMGGISAEQGYGSLGSGPGGVNQAINKKWVTGTGNKGLFGQTNITPVERPFVVPQSGIQYFPSDVVSQDPSRPWRSSFGGSTAVLGNPSSYSAPAPPPTQTTPFVEGPVG